MEKLYMGLDIGSTLTKGVIIDRYNNIIASNYLYTMGKPVEKTKEVIKKMIRMVDFSKYRIVSVGVTGMARKLIGLMLDASVIKNEITAEAIGVTNMYPEIKTIISIGGQGAKLISVNDGKMTNFTMNTLCSSGIGNFIDNWAIKLGVQIDDVGELALTSKKDLDISDKCTIYAGVSIYDKMLLGYNTEDILKGICKMVAKNYIFDIVKERKLEGPIFFNGGVSKNKCVIKELERMLNNKLITSNNACLMGALGVAILARYKGIEREFDKNIDDYSIETKLINCLECVNKCEVVTIYKNNELIDTWGRKCSRKEFI